MNLSTRVGAKCVTRLTLAEESQRSKITSGDEENHELAQVVVPLMGFDVRLLRRIAKPGCQRRPARRWSDMRRLFSRGPAITGRGGQGNTHFAQLLLAMRALPQMLQHLPLSLGGQRVAHQFGKARANVRA
jgi:hypothetical protein